MKTGATRYIRSGKARHYLNNFHDEGNINGTTYFSINRASNAVKFAEDEARNRMSIAFCRLF